MLKPAGLRNRRGGAAAAELAIVLPFLALMFTVALDFCRIYYATQTIQQCAWVGALYASGTATDPNANSAEDAAQQAAVNESVSLDPPVQTCDVQVSYQGSVAQVSVHYEFRGLTPLMGDGGRVTITRTVKMNMAPTGP
jgi:Flp pilus assembly protein TadG